MIFTKFLLLALAAASLLAQRPDIEDRSIEREIVSWKWSTAALVASSIVDIHSSQGHYELNPILGRGPFGSRQVTIKLSLTGGIVLAEVLLVRKWPRVARKLKWVNFGAATATGAVAARNYRQ